MWTKNIYTTNANSNTQYKIVIVSELTPESPVHSLDSAENHTAPSVLNPAACCSSGPDVSGGRGWTSELRPEKNS